MDTLVFLDRSLRCYVFVVVAVVTSARLDLRRFFLSLSPLSRPPWGSTVTTAFLCHLVLLLRWRIRTRKSQRYCSFNVFRSRSTAGLRFGTSRVAASQTMSVSMSKYPCTRMFRILMMFDQGISGARARTSSGRPLDASPMIAPAFESALQLPAAHPHAAADPQPLRHLRDIQHPFAASRRQQLLRCSKRTAWHGCSHRAPKRRRLCQAPHAVLLPPVPLVARHLLLSHAQELVELCLRKAASYARLGDEQTLVVLISVARLTIIPNTSTL